MEVLDDADGIPGIAYASVVGWVLADVDRRSWFVTLIRQAVDEDLSTYMNRTLCKDGSLGTLGTFRPLLESFCTRLLGSLETSLEGFEESFVDDMTDRSLQTVAISLRPVVQTRAAAYQRAYPHFAAQLEPFAQGEPEPLRHLLRGIISRDLHGLLTRVHNGEVYQGIRTPRLIELERAEQLVPAALLRTTIQAINTTVAGVVGLKLRQQATEERRNHKSKFINNTARRVSAVTDTELQLTVGEKILAGVNRSTDPFDAYLAAATVVIEKPGEFWWSRHVDDVEYTVTKRALEAASSGALKEAVEATRTTLKSTGKRNVPTALSELAEKPRALRNLFGPRLAALTAAFWLMPVEEREDSLPALVRRHITPLSSDEIGELLSSYRRGFSRAEAGYEVEAARGELERVASNIVLRWASANAPSGADAMCEWIASGGLSWQIIGEVFATEISVVTEVHYQLRDNAQIGSIFEALLDTPRADQRIREEVPPLATGLARVVELPSLANSTLKILAKLHEIAFTTNMTARRVNDLRKMIASERALLELSRSVPQDFELCVQQECEVLIEKGILTHENFDVFDADPLLFLDISSMYDGLFGEAVVGLPGGANLTELATLAAMLPRADPGTISVAHNGNAVLIVRGEPHNDSQRERFEAAARCEAEAFLLIHHTGCSRNAASQTTQGEYSIPIEQALGFIDKFMDGSGRGQGNQFHFGGSNNILGKDWLVLAAMGFFKNEPDRFPLSREVLDLLASIRTPALEAKRNSDLIDWRAVDTELEGFWPRLLDNITTAFVANSRSKAIAGQVVLSQMKGSLIQSLMERRSLPSSHRNIFEWAADKYANDIAATVEVSDRLAQMLIRSPQSSALLAFVRERNEVWGAIHCTLDPGKYLGHDVPLASPRALWIFRIDRECAADNWDLVTEKAPGGWMSRLESEDLVDRFVENAVERGIIARDSVLLLPELCGETLLTRMRRWWIESVLKRVPPLARQDLRFDIEDEPLYIGY